MQWIVILMIAIDNSVCRVRISEIRGVARVYLIPWRNLGREDRRGGCWCIWKLRRRWRWRETGNQSAIGLLPRDFRSFHFTIQLLLMDLKKRRLPRGYFQIRISIKSLMYLRMITSRLQNRNRSSCLTIIKSLIRFFSITIPHQNRMRMTSIIERHRYEDGVDEESCWQNGVACRIQNCSRSIYVEREGARELAWSRFSDS